MVTRLTLSEIMVLLALPTALRMESGNGNNN